MKRNTKQSSMHRSDPKPEFGDWRTELSRPEEAEHYPAPSVNSWKNGPARNLGQEEQAIFRPMINDAVREAYRSEQDHSGTDAYGILPLSGWAKTWRAFIGIVLFVPLSIIMIMALVNELSDNTAVVENLGFWLSTPVWYSLLGIMTFTALTIMRLLSTACVYMYVLGHELTHAVAILLCGGKISKIHVTADQGGYVMSNKSNIFISLSPYFVPFWMLVWMLVLWLINYFSPFAAYEGWFYAGFGFWWSFHLYWTVWSIRQEQPDMLDNGLIFSLLLTFVLNVLSLTIIMYAFGLLTLNGYFYHFRTAAGELYDTFCNLLF